MHKENFFLPELPVYSAESPGRLDVMGGIADYSGSFLLQMPIRQTTKVEIQKRTDRQILLRTLLDKKKYKEFQIGMDELPVNDLDACRVRLHKNSEDAWAAYVIGCLLMISRERSLDIQGATVMVQSNVPWGKGVSSSAALEVATLHALCKAYGFRLDQTELAVLAQKVENLVVGAACGLMDQLTVQFGEKNKLLPLVCQPHQVFEPVRIPRGIYFPAIDSGIRHAVGGASYGQVRAAAFMAYTIIAQKLGATVQDLKHARLTGQISQLPFNGYLSNIPVSIFETQLAELLPSSISGTEFMEAYEVSIDPASRIEPNKIYDLKACARHPVYENLRVRTFSCLLQAISKKNMQQKQLLHLIGEYMYQSHAGYSSVGLGNERTDEIVAMVRELGEEHGLFGARVSGGGSGGTVVLCAYGSEGLRSAREVHRRYCKKYRQKLFFFLGSNHGALSLNPFETAKSIN